VDNELRSRDRALVIVRPSPAVLRLLQLTSLDDRLRIEAAS
jgi:anti-anti-sigma regulatory factor